MSVPSKFYDFVDDSEALRLFAQPIVFFLSFNFFRYIFGRRWLQV